MSDALCRRASHVLCQRRQSLSLGECIDRSRLSNTRVRLHWLVGLLPLWQRCDAEWLWLGAGRLQWHLGSVARVRMLTNAVERVALLRATVHHHRHSFVRLLQQHLEQLFVVVV